MRRALLVVLGTTALVNVGIFSLLSAGVRVWYNVGPSVAPGWYLCGGRVPADPPVPLLVEVHPPQGVDVLYQRLAGAPLRTEVWLKYLVTRPGQWVCAQGDALTIDGQVVATRPLAERYPLPVEGCWLLGKDDVMVLGTHPDSFDSRYTGPWKRASLTGTCRALWTWEVGP
jgi:type IV secretory pathway protease TraF